MDLYPCLFDRVATTNFDAHYLYQAVWATEKIAATPGRIHVDVGSDSRFVSVLTLLQKVIFVDIRSLRLGLDRFEEVKGSLVSLPFRSKSLSSVSCLSVVEHIGLGRYGDTIDPTGFVSACQELVRVLAPGGNLYIALPVGRGRVCFNAHRVTPSTRLPSLVPTLNLTEFSVVNDAGQYLRNVNVADYDDCEYANGLFHFVKTG